MKTIIDEVRQQHAFFDLFAKGWIADYEALGKRTFCRRGCSGCCSLAVNCSFMDAVTLAPELSRAQEAAVAVHVERLQEIASEAVDIKSFLHLHRSRLGACPLLAEDGSCGIYFNRPLSCRSLHSTRESRWCTTNFAALDTAEKGAFMADLDRDVVAFPLHYVRVLQELGQELETACNRRMGETLGWYLYGSMPVLLFLLRTFNAEWLCAQREEGIRRVLAELSLDHPFLLSIGL